MVLSTKFELNYYEDLVVIGWIGIISYISINLSQHTDPALILNKNEWFQTKITLEEIIEGLFSMLTCAKVRYVLIQNKHLNFESDQIHVVWLQYFMKINLSFYVMYPRILVSGSFMVFYHSSNIKHFWCDKFQKSNTYIFGNVS